MTDTERALPKLTTPSLERRLPSATKR